MNRAVIYARYSSKNQNDYSIEAQITSCVEYAEKHNMEIINIYRDKAITAKTDRRPGFKEMIKDSYKGEFDTIIVWAVDRFARNMRDAENNMELLVQNKVQIVSVTEYFDNSPQGELMRGFLNLWAQYYSKSLAVNVKRGMNQNVDYCYFNGGTIPFGFDIVNANDGISTNKRPKKKYQVNEDKRHIVEEMFQRYADGESMKAIYMDLNARGILNNKGEPFTRTSLNSILRNKRYTGTYIFNGEEVPNGIPRIISDELFKKVQEKLVLNKLAPARSLAKEEYLLTGKLYCGDCGEAMTGISGTSCNKTTYRYYTCKKDSKNAHINCETKNFRKDKLEELVLEKANMVLTEDNINRIAKEMYDLGQELKNSPEYLDTVKLLADNKKERDNLMNVLRHCGGSDSVAKDILTELERLKGIQEHLENKIKEIENSAEAITYEEIVFFF